MLYGFKKHCDEVTPLTLSSFSVHQRRRVVGEASARPSGSGHGLLLLPAAFQLPGPSGRTLPAVQLVSLPDRLASRAGQNCNTHTHLSFRGSASLKCSLCLDPQIRLALRNWEDMKQFEKDAVDAQHLDAVYILRKLMFHRAFHFTAMPTLVSCPAEKNDTSSKPF